MGLFSPQKKNADSFKVGFIAAFSYGPYVHIVDNQYKGARLAVEEINEEGGINGRLVELIPKDDHVKVDRAREVAKELVAEGVHMLAGSMSSETQISINEIATAARIPFVSCSQSDEIGKANVRGPYTFHEAMTPHMTNQFIARWGYESLGKRWAGVIMDFPWAHQSHKVTMEHLKTLGGTDVGSVVVPFGGTVEQYEAAFDEIISFKPEVINVRAFGQDQTNFIKAAARRGLKREAPIMIGISEKQFVEGLPLDDLVGIYWATNFYWGLEATIPEAKHFVTSFRKHFDDEVPSGYAGYAYAGVKEMLIALRETKFDGRTYEPMREFLEGRHYNHYKGAEWWRPCDHQSFQDLQILRFKGPEESTNKEDIAELMGSVSWDLSIERTCEEMGYITPKNI